MKNLIGPVILALSALLLVSGCSSSSSSTPPPTTLTGTAATGAPIIGSVTVKGAKGVEVTIATGTDGSFTLDVKGMTAPYLLKIMPSTGPVLYSYASANGQTVNLTPATNLAMFLASGNQDLSAIYNAWNGTAITAAQVSAAQDVVVANLETQLSAAGLTPASFDFFTTSFKANSTGVDGLLDNLKIAVDAAAGSFTFTDANNVAIAFDENITPVGNAGTGGTGGNGGTGGSIAITTVTGGSHNLSGIYTSNCYQGEGGSGTSQLDSLAITGDGTTWVNSSLTYASTNCTGATTDESVIVATVTKGSDVAISGWLDGMRNSAPAPVAASGDGSLLSDPTSADGTAAYTGNVTQLTLAIVSVTGQVAAFVSVGQSSTAFYVVDDTGSDLVIYRDQDGSASLADPYVFQLQI